MRSDHAFTLIELLIVVAIIAILAAIAVPNFLEAQTRAKVSRTYSDMRSMATALESYAIDYNRYVPFHFSGGTSEVWGIPVGGDVTIDGTYGTLNPRILRYIPLTTPVSYITSVPLDIFSDEIDPLRRYWRCSDRDSYFGASLSTTFYNNFYAQNTATKWLLRSAGPSRVDLNSTNDTFPAGFGAEDTYDPTNGTLSPGNISFAGPGDSIIGD
ncbi:prepilin-type N-terminal cleavage/methylation domain-containing protein [Candidatus Sumerlaeota bacterium]|nr:prepilin-type N-terminal cleavage/methylation domain-containing protein [Candidatus Sumerlaeota bacterium]